MRTSNLGMGVFALALSAHCQAVVNGYSPATSNPPNPSTGLTTQNWKFVGSAAGSSATQITPRFIIASRHGGPSAGNLFVNHFGQATVSSCENPPSAGPVYARGSSEDLALCLLSSGITPDIDFPPLVDDGNTTPFSGHTYQHWGNVYMVGFAGGSRHAAWASINGFPPEYNPFDISSTPIGNAFDASGIVPYTAVGDSGGAAYWFPPDSAVGALQGILLQEGGADGSFARFTPATLNWIQDRIQNAGFAPPTRVHISQFYGDYQSQLPRMMKPGTVSVAVTGATSATITWTTPPVGTGDSTATITKYYARLQAVGETSFFYRNTTAAGSWSPTNLADGKTYQACVMTGNALGYGPNAYYQFADKTINRAGCVTFQAGQPNYVTTLDYEITKNASGNTDLSAWWTPPVSNGVTIGSYVVNIKIWPSNVATSIPPSETRQVTTPVPSVKSKDLGPGKRVCWSVTAVSASGVTNTSPANYTQCFFTLN